MSCIVISTVFYWTGSLRDASYPTHVTVHKGTTENFSSTAEADNKTKADTTTQSAEAGEDLYHRYLAMHNNLKPHVQQIVSALDLFPYKTAVDLGGELSFYILEAKFIHWL